LNFFDELSEEDESDDGSPAGDTSADGPVDDAATVPPDASAA
jgi:hypothetical protein